MLDCEGKLTELGHEPIGVQAIVSDINETLHLVDEGGIIKTVNLSAHVISDQDVIERSALRDTSDLEQLRQLVKEHESTIETLRGELCVATDTISELQIACANAETLTREVASLKSAVETEKLKSKRFWRLRCEQILEQEDVLQAKDAEIAQLREELTAAKALPRPMSATSTPFATPPRTNLTRSVLEGDEPNSTILATTPARRGKAPPIEPFTGEGPSVHWDDWLPTLERAATWNNWNEQEKLIQLAGHLRGKAQREWDLMAQSSKTSFAAATEALQARLDSVNRVVAAQDFRHLSQQATETVSDFICRLEKTFRRAYGHERMSEETRSTLLYGQLNEGLKYSLIKASAVSGASGYQQLCTAARNEERRQGELLKRQQYQQGDCESIKPDRFVKDLTSHTGHDRLRGEKPIGSEGSTFQNYRPKCWNCKKTGHQAKDCRLPKRESTGRSEQIPSAKMAQSDARQDPMMYLLSDSDDDEDSRVGLVRIADGGSKCHRAKVIVGGVPLLGIVDSGADITIMGGTAFRQVASVAKLHKRDFKAPDKIP